MHTDPNPRGILLLLAAVNLAACVDDRVAARDSSSDTTAIAQVVARHAVPQLAAGRTAELVATSRVGRRFDSVFTHELAPASARLRGGSASPDVLVAVSAERMLLEGDSAVVTLRREGMDRADSTRRSSNETRYTLRYVADSGWVLRGVDASNFQGEGKPADRPRDVWEKGRDTARRR